MGTCSLAGWLLYLTAMDGGNVGFAGELIDPAGRSDMSSVSVAAPEAHFHDRCHLP